jgi:Protein of unknown function (DUF1553)/Protein of unknown function (DUF1549)/Planctomycete cytochrome C
MAYEQRVLGTIAIFYGRASPRGDFHPCGAMNWRRSLAVCAVLGVLAAVTVLPALRGREVSQRIDFRRDIRPIFNQSCVSCHGGVRQTSGVSFIYRQAALGKGKSGRPTIVPGHPERSELIARVTSTDPEVRMPYHASPLSPERIALLRQWIKEGAEWQDHWAFVAPKPQAVPSVENWPRQPLDQFILARLEKEGLEPSPEASRAALLRRASFDLVGLPPTPAELSSFLADASADAYEKQVDRLLASPQFGERWAALWLDLARYADSKGYEADLPRFGMWPYRDWVISALNRNVPYDQFVIAQLAGDLLPNATLEDRIATAFHRQTPANDEAGSDDEEFRVMAVLDRVSTTWSVLNGVTIGCVQCHSHPYDPIQHVEYYKSVAFFNTSSDSDLGSDWPTLRVPKETARYGEANQLQNDLAGLRREITQEARQMAVDATQWRPLPIVAVSLDEVQGFQWLLARLRSGHVPDEFQYLVDSMSEGDPQKYGKAKKQFLQFAIEATTRSLQSAQSKATVVSGGPPVLTVRDGEVWTDKDNTPPPSVYELKAETQERLLTALRIEAPPLNADTARHTPEPGFVVDRVEAWVVAPSGQEQKIAFRYFAPDAETNVDRGLEPDESDPNRSALGGFETRPKHFHTRWTVGIPLTPVSLPSGGHIRVRLTQTGFIDNRSAFLHRVRLFTSSDPKWTQYASRRLDAGDYRRLQYLKSQLARIPAVDLPIIEEQESYERRATLEFERGNFLTKTGLPLQPDVPRLFSNLPAGATPDRLTLAKWFFMPGQSLTARVAVNRYWEQLFGTGIVETLEDFGSAGQPPSHPELLDWLALHFQNDLHWNMKALLRELVTSATYRQSAQITPSMLEKDPRNRLLSRGPQQRLTAEMVRDQALFASGLLNLAMGGPPVRPPTQPGEISVNTDGTVQWVDSTGPDRYRRAIYTYVKRAAMYPSFLTFDGSLHDVSLARRIPTNTPLQALVTLNDPVYHEAAQSLAERMVKDTVVRMASVGPDAQTVLLDARLSYGVHCVLSREPTSQELTILRGLYQDALALSVERSRKSGALPARTGMSRELSALTAVAGVIFNLDAALTR